MASRLNRNARESLAKKLITRSFNKKAQDFTYRSAELAVRVYRFCYAADLKKMEALPNGWLPTYDDITVIIGGEHVAFYFAGTWKQSGRDWRFILAGVDRVDRIYHRFPNATKGQSPIVIEASNPLCDEYRAMDAEFKDLVSEIESAHRTLVGTLDKFATVESLIKAWPEVEEFAKPYLSDETRRKAMLPVIPIDRLNAILDLPPEAE